MDGKSLPTTSAVAHADIEQFEKDLKEKKGDAQLDTWYKYVTYMEEYQSQKINIMKRCVKYYNNVTKFNQSEKFVKIWLKFASVMDEPDIMYKHMFDRKIGTSFASLYKEWSRYCATYEEGCTILELGIKNNSELVSTLEDYKGVLLDEMKKPKINCSHKYYNHAVFSQPGTVWKFCHAKLYKELYEQSFEELKAKLPKYSKSRTADDNAPSTTNASVENKVINMDVVDEEEIERPNNRLCSLTFIASYDSPDVNNQNENVFEDMLDDLDITRAHPNVLKPPQHINIQQLIPTDICPTSSNIKSHSEPLVIDGNNESVEELRTQPNTPSLNEGCTDNKVQMCVPSPAINNSSIIPGNQTLASPTVTMCTKSAVKSVSNMFSAAFTDPLGTPFQKTFEKPSKGFQDTPSSATFDTIPDELSFAEFPKQHPEEFKIFEDTPVDRKKENSLRNSKGFQGTTLSTTFDTISDDLSFAEFHKQRPEEFKIFEDTPVDKKKENSLRSSKGFDVFCDVEDGICQLDNPKVTQKPNLIDRSTSKNIPSDSNKKAFMENIMYELDLSMDDNDKTLYDTPGNPIYESTRSKFQSTNCNLIRTNNQKLTAVLNESDSGTPDKQRSPLKELINNEVEPFGHVSSKQKLHYENEIDSSSEDILVGLKKESVKKSIACPNEVMKSGIVGVPPTSSKGINDKHKQPNEIGSKKGTDIQQLKRLNDLCDFDDDDVNENNDFEQMFQKGKSDVGYSFQKGKGTDTVRDTKVSPGGMHDVFTYSINDVSAGNVKSSGGKRDIASCADEETEEVYSSKRLKRFASTPSSLSHNHCVTFGQQMNFEKTEISHLSEDIGVHLSPIVEISNEESKGAGDRTNECRSESESA